MKYLNRSFASIYLQINNDMNESTILTVEACYTVLGVDIEELLLTCFVICATSSNKSIHVIYYLNHKLFNQKIYIAFPVDILISFK